jgi:hypothetical protein
MPYLAVSRSSFSHFFHSRDDRATADLVEFGSVKILKLKDVEARKSRASFNVV